MLITGFGAIWMGCLDRSGLDPIDAGAAGTGTGGWMAVGGSQVPAGTGGTESSGGAPGTGGDFSASGGAVSTGGDSATGGGVASGGHPMTMTGDPMTGGASSSGGRATGGAAGTGGFRGTGGGPSGTGGKGTVMCPAVCTIYCPYGNVVDASGCATCQCKTDPNACDAGECGEPPIEPVTVVCTNGAGGTTTTTAGGVASDVALVAPAPTPPASPYVCQRNANGRCVWQKGGCRVCPALACSLACDSSGFKIGALGCPVCACNPQPQPTADCSGHDSSSACAADAACRWLHPGCGEPTLAAAGCFARAGIGCDGDGQCPTGQRCLKRSIDPCPGGAAGSGSCAACGVIQAICL